MFNNNAGATVHGVLLTGIVGYYIHELVYCDRMIFDMSPTRVINISLCVYPIYLTQPHHLNCRVYNSGIGY